MASLSSVPPSQTAKEHEELLRYEQNLASCYEAEYLLSLKLQEDIMMRSRSGGSDASTECYYDDVYETQQQVCPSIPDHNLPTNVISMGTVFGGVESMETGSGTNYHHLPANIGKGLATDLQQVSPASSQYSDHSLRVSMVQIPDTCKKRIENGGEYHFNVGHHQDGEYSDTANWSAHIEGPARKKCRLQQSEF